jgi:hypothetical protein
MWKVIATVVFTDMTSRQISKECRNVFEVEDLIAKCIRFPPTSSCTFEVKAPPFESKDD